MKIERGIIGFTLDGKIGVDSPFHFYDLKLNSGFTDDLKVGDKLLGVVIEDIYHICYEISQNSINGFGYILNCSNENIELQLINGFDKQKFNPFEQSYEIGEVVTLNNEIVKESADKINRSYY